MPDLEQLIEQEFPVIDSVIHLNHAAVAPWPSRTLAAVRKFAEENNRIGSRNYEQWMATEKRLREQAADLLGTGNADDIALLKNTSEGLSVIAHGFPWKPGGNVVTSDQEFPSNRIVWQSLAGKGVEARQVSLPCPGDPEQALIDACDTHTQLLSVSSVEYSSGLKIDLVRLGEMCRQRGIAFCVDAIQGLGVFPHEVEQAHIDFLVADGHKWLLAPEGLAIFYCAPVWRERLELHQYGWHMVEDLYNFSNPDWVPASSARRFECGSPNMLGITALDQSLGLLLEIGAKTIWQRVRERTELLFESINARPELELISCTEEQRYAGITVFRHRDQSAQEVYDRLVANKVLCAMRGGGVRFAPHFYIPLSQIEQAVALAAGPA